MKVFALKMAVVGVRFFAAFFNLFVKRREGVLLISCQSDKPTQDILELAAAIEGLSCGRVTVMAGQMKRSIGGAFLFAGRMASMLRRIAAARVVAVDAYCPAVSIPKKRPGQEVVMLWHAPEAIKKFSLQITDTPVGYSGKTAEILCMHRGYDYILCPSDATRPFFVEAFGYPESVFVKYGLPSLDRVWLMKRPAPGVEEAPERAAKRAEIHERYPILAVGGSISCDGGGASGGNNVAGSYGDDAGRSGVGPGDRGSCICRDGSRRMLTVVYAPTFRDGTGVDAAGLAQAFASVADRPGDGIDMPADGPAEGSDGLAGAGKSSGLLRSAQNDPGPGGFGAQWAGIALILKLHPLDAVKGGENAGAQELRDFSGSTISVIEDEEFPLIDWYSVADIVVTDYSGVAVEAAAAGIASYYYIYDVDEYTAKRGLNVDLRKEAVGKYAFKDADALAEQALRDFSGEIIYDYEALAAFAGKYLEVPLSGNTERLAAFIKELRTAKEDFVAEI